MFIKKKDKKDIKTKNKVFSWQFLLIWLLVISQILCSKNTFKNRIQFFFNFIEKCFQDIPFSEVDYCGQAKEYSYS